MTTDFDADIKNFKDILNELELKTHTKNGYKFSPDAKMAAGWWFFEIYMEQEFARKIIETANDHILIFPSLINGHKAIIKKNVKKTIPKLLFELVLIFFINIY